MDDRTLIKRCLEDDELAWETLITRYQGRVCSIAFTYTGNEDEALDVAQEVFVRVWRRLDSCREHDRFATWLLQIARHACLDHLRRRKARPPSQDLAADELPTLADPGARPDDEIDRQDQLHIVERALQRLSAINREAILLKDIQGLPLQEMADLLDVPLGTAKSRCTRARLELASVVAGMLDGGPSGGPDLGAEAAR